jgi:copper chaperone CopZ
MEGRPIMVALRSSSMDLDLHALHVRTRGMHCEQCTALIEFAVSSLPGVREVTAVQAMSLTSILFDRSQVDRETITRAIREAGFAAEVASPEH